MMSLVFYAQQVLLLLAEISMQIYTLVFSLLEYLLFNCLGFFVSLNLGTFSCILVHPVDVLSNFGLVDSVGIHVEPIAEPMNFEIFNYPDVLITCGRFEAFKL